MNCCLDRRSLELRRTVIRILACSRRGHLGPTMSLMEIMRVLYDDILRYDPARPDWPERDRCILSKGHGCLAQYVLLADKGFFPPERLWEFCSYGAMLGGHPDRGKVPGVEASTGSLGHGLSIGVGFALNARIERRPSRVFVVMGDGECNEGSVWEAAMSAAKHRLDNLCVLVDANGLQSYGPTSEVLDMEPVLDKWRGFGFSAAEVDGHDVAALRGRLAGVPLESGRPTALICRTVKGKGIDFAEHDLNWHHKSAIGEELAGRMMEALERHACAEPA